MKLLKVFLVAVVVAVSTSAFSQDVKLFTQNNNIRMVANSTLRIFL